MRVEPPLILVRSRGTDCTLATAGPCMALGTLVPGTVGINWVHLIHSCINVGTAGNVIFR